MELTMKDIASSIPDDKPLWQLTVGEFKALVANKPVKSGDELLTVEQVEGEFKVGREGLKAAAGRGELTLVRGGKRRILVRRADVAAWVESRPVSPRLRKATPFENEDPLSQMIAHGELRVTKGSGR